MGANELTNEREVNWRKIPITLKTRLRLTTRRKSRTLPFSIDSGSTHKIN